MFSLQLTFETKTSNGSKLIPGMLSIKFKSVIFSVPLFFTFTKKVALSPGFTVGVVVCFLISIEGEETYTKAHSFLSKTNLLFI